MFTCYGWVHGWTDGWMDGISICMFVCMCRRMDGQMNGWVYRWVDGWEKGSKRGRTDGWMLEYSDGNIAACSCRWQKRRTPMTKTQVGERLVSEVSDRRVAP